MQIDQVQLSNYKDQIHLNRPFLVQSKSLDLPKREQLVDTLLEELSSEILSLGGLPPAKSYQEKRRLLYAVINTIPPNRLNTKNQNLLDSLLQAELLEKQIVTPQDIEVVAQIGQTKIGLWQGDITCLKVDAIVNAANNQMLGCFQPLHKCIDNAIHSAAGVQLRDDCQKIMQIQGTRESTGDAKITRGYNLPSSYVLHTVGPIVQHTVTSTHEKQLSNSYKNCLALSTKISDINSIAFCCISTGVFGYPQEAAATVAVKTVADWLRNHDHNLEMVVFNVFLEKDLFIYQKIFETYE